MYIYYGDKVTALAIRRKVRQQVFAINICQFEGILMAKFSYLFLLATRVHNWIKLHSYVEKHKFAKTTFYWPTCI